MNNGYKYLTVVFFAVICFLICYIVIDDRDRQKPVVNDQTDVLNQVANLKILPNNLDGFSSYRFYVNNSEVILDDPMAQILDMSFFDDFVIYLVNYVDNNSLIIADYDTNIIARYGVNGITLKGSTYRGEYRVNDGYIYLTSDNLAQDDIAVVCGLYQDNKNDDIVFIEKMKYLGNNKFSGLVLDSTVKVNDYIKNNNIDCTVH